MKRHVHVAALALVALSPLVAQTPKGWKMRVDRSTAASDPDASGDIKFVTMGSGFHATNPQAAVYWNPANTATGTYTLKGTFTLMKPSGHTNYYGLVFGGSGLEGAAAELSVLRGGAERDVADQTPRRRRHQQHRAEDAQRRGEEAGRRRQIHQCSRSPRGRRQGRFRGQRDGGALGTEERRLAKTDGIYGIRVNHLLEVQVDGLGVSK